MDHADKELVDYFIGQTNERFRILEIKIDELQRFKWQIVGMSGLAGGLMSILVSIGFIFLQRFF